MTKNRFTFSVVHICCAHLLLLPRHLLSHVLTSESDFSTKEGGLKFSSVDSFYHVKELILVLCRKFATCGAYTQLLTELPEMTLFCNVCPCLSELTKTPPLTSTIIQQAWLKKLMHHHVSESEGISIQLE